MNQTLWDPGRGAPHFKKGRRVLWQEIRVRCAFIRDHKQQHALRTLCRLLRVHPSGYYTWKHHPQSGRSIENRHLTGQVKESWLQSGAVYDYRKMHTGLRDLGEWCREQRVYRLMRQAGLRS